MTSRGNSPRVSESESTDEEIRLMQYGKCEYCGRTKTDDKWCMICSSRHFKSLQWTSGSDVIDKFIRDIQVRATNRLKVLEWVPYENFSDIKYLAKGGYGVVYKAKWKGGYIRYLDSKTQQWRRHGDIEVVLKSLYGSKNISKEFLDEIDLQMKSHYAHGNTIECYGITKDPETKDFMMIMNFMDAAKGLSDIHEAKLIHKDLHTGNIVLSGLTSFITDFGFCKPADYSLSDEAENNKIFGVMPYIAPEILCGKKYTQAADVYAFGVIMNEVASGYPPYHNTPHDSHLALQIVQGTRPEINEDITPKLIVDLIRKCWNVKPENRPDAIELHDSLWRWFHHSTLKRSNEIREQVEKIEKSQNFERFLAAVSGKNNISMSYSLHSDASLKSKLFDITSVVKSVKISRAESVSDTGIVDLVIPESIEDSP